MKKVETSNCRFTILEGFLPDPLRVKVQNLMNQWKNSQLELYSIRGLYDYTHTVDHGYNHTLRVLRIASQILLPYLSKSPEFLNEYEIFCLISAIWLHDIGLGYMPDEGSHFWEVVYKNHGIYSEKRILGDERELILPGVDDELVNSIGQICCYHQKKKPLTKSQQEALVTDMMPIKEKISYKKKDIRLKFLAALLQLADGCDIGYRRAISEARAKKEQRKIDSECEELKDILAILKEAKSKELKGLKELESEARLRALEQIERIEQFINRFTVKLERLKNQISKHHFKHLAVETVYPIKKAEKEVIDIMIIPSQLGRTRKTKKEVEEGIDYALEDIQEEFKLVNIVLGKHGIILGNTYLFESFDLSKKAVEKALNEIRRNVKSDSGSISNNDKSKIEKLIELVSNKEFEAALSKSKSLIAAVEKKHQKREPILSALRCIRGLVLSCLAYWEKASIEYNKVSVDRGNWRKLAEKRISSLDKDTDKDGWPDEFEILYGADIYDYTKHPTKFKVRACSKVN